MRKRKTMKSSEQIRFTRKKPVRSANVPVTKAMLFGVRDELKEYVQSKIHGVQVEIQTLRGEFEGLRGEFGVLRVEMNAKVEGLRGEIHDLRVEMNTKVEGLRGEIECLRTEMYEMKAELKADIHEIKSEIHGLKADVHKLCVLIEEQNARNIVVLDGLNGLFIRQERVEKRVDDFSRDLAAIREIKSS